MKQDLSMNLWFLNNIILNCILTFKVSSNPLYTQLDNETDTKYSNIFQTDSFVYSPRFMSKKFNSPIIFKSIETDNDQEVSFQKNNTPAILVSQTFQLPSEDIQDLMMNEPYTPQTIQSFGNKNTKNIYQNQAAHHIYEETPKTYRNAPEWRAYSPLPSTGNQTSLHIDLTQFQNINSQMQSPQQSRYQPQSSYLEEKVQTFRETLSDNQQQFEPIIFPRSQQDNQSYQFQPQSQTNTLPHTPDSRIQNYQPIQHNQFQQSQSTQLNAKPFSKTMPYNNQQDQRLHYQKQDQNFNSHNFTQQRLKTQSAVQSSQQSQISKVQRDDFRKNARYNACVLF